ncbi:MAG: hypothetical protein IKZ39_01430 [Lachnospiraceae bacterium]|nr:hypothetical protein [Lachnospiraceae bacterium]
MEKTILILNIFALLGFPTVFAIIAAVLKRMGKISDQIKILMKAQQEQMRGQLLKDYYTYKNRGYVYEYEIRDWELQYKAYHSLGENGIMDKRYESLMSMETRKEAE